MRSIRGQEAGRAAEAGDLTARARIRDAAVMAFAQDGFGVSVRQIAEAAGVSPGLIMHHFGSKDGLKEECDRQVGRVLVDIKTNSMAVAPEMARTNLLQQLAEADSYAYLIEYILQSVRAGGEAAQRFLAIMVESTSELLRRGVEAGTMRPSIDPEARARYLTYSGVGWLLTWRAASPTASIRDMTRELTPTVLEFCSQALLTSSELFDSYLEHQDEKADPNE